MRKSPQPGCRPCSGHKKQPVASEKTEKQLFALLAFDVFCRPFSAGSTFDNFNRVFESSRSPRCQRLTVAALAPPSASQGLASAESTPAASSDLDTPRST